jgi:hypothetical protein
MKEASLQLTEIMEFVDAHRQLSSLIKTGCLLLVGFLVLASVLTRSLGAHRSWWRRPRLFLICLPLCLFAYRFPVLCYPFAINPDEAQMLAQAITYQNHPIPWRDVDGTTSGPINSYALLWCVTIGLHPGYSTARLTGMFCALGMLMFLFLAGRRIAGDVGARIALMPIFLFLCFTQAPDFIHYSSEQVSLLFLGCAIYLMTRLHGRPGSLFLNVSLGFVLGMLPYAKLQSTLPGAFLGFASAWILWTSARGNVRQALARVMILIAAALLPSILILSVVLAAGAMNDFWQSYIQMARTYGPVYSSIKEGLKARSSAVVHLFAPNSGVGIPIFLTAIWPAMVALLILVRKLKLTRVTRDWLLLAILFLGVILVTILFTGFSFVHYDLYLLPGLYLVMLVHLRALRTGLRSDVWKYNRPQRVRCATAACFSLVFVLPAFALSSSANQDKSWVQGYGVTCLKTQFFRQKSDGKMIRAVLEVRPPGWRMAIWGWASEYSAETGTPLGTRDSISQFLILPGPLQNYYRQRYLQDMENNRPELFLEATGPANFAFVDTALDGINSFPQLAKLIFERYRVYREIDGMRLFLRSDFFSEDSFSTVHPP